MRTIYFSPSNKSFYLVYSDVKNLPDDIKEVSKKEYDAIFEDLDQTELGYDKVLSCDDSGNPKVLKNKLPVTPNDQVIRNKRNRLLKETDWSQLPDVPEVIRDQYKEYRQSLRDVTRQSTFPDSVKWPNKPD